MKYITCLSDDGKLGKVHHISAGSRVQEQTICGIYIIDHDLINSKPHPETTLCKRCIAAKDNFFIESI